MLKKITSINELINSDSLPRHVAIIMDGNGRWARKRLMPRTMGHRAGMASLKKVVKACDEFEIPILTVYAFSTENWKRPENEVQFLMKLLVEFLHKELDELNENNVCINVIGDYSVLNQECQDEIRRALLATRNNQGLLFNIALNYGARAEMVEAIKKIVDKVISGEIPRDSICEATVSSFLYTGGVPDPDLLIRTAGELRLSNFLLWQLAYTELWVTERLWPDFTREDLIVAIQDYQQRDRRFGALTALEKGDENV
ncbi:MAG: isoprenyl transferase [Syntrophomonadaceae bacterium]|nr:isoprenyl transferase [Syntrophomonadaceae bacterium]